VLAIEPPISENVTNTPMTARNTRSHFNKTGEIFPVNDECANQTTINVGIENAIPNGINKKMAPIFVEFLQ